MSQKTFWEIGIENQLSKKHKEILETIFKYRVLTTKQIHQLFYPSSKINTVHTRMHLFKKKGYITTKPIIGEKGRKITSAYFLTDKGLSVLQENGVLTEGVKSHHLELNGYHLVHTVDAIEVFVQLKHFGWSFKDSREVKKNHGMNRGNLIHGSLISPDGEEIGLHIFKEKPIEKTIARFIIELETNNTLEQTLVLVHNKEIYQRIRAAFIEKGVTRSGKPLGLMPYKFGIQALKEIGATTGFLNRIKSFGEVTPLQSGFLFSKYIIKHNGEEKLVANFLLGDQTLLYYLSQYNQDRYLMKQQKVLLFAWEGQREELETYFKYYPHIERIYI
jgi:hypothetical protein